MKKTLAIILQLLFVILAVSCNSSGKRNEHSPQFATFVEVSPSQIHPNGWLREFLMRQKEGLTGHIEVAGYPFNGPMWTGSYAVNTEERFWWPYEQTGYFVDGCLRAGYLLGDSSLINKAKIQIDYVLANQQPNGKLGPANLKGRWNLWPFAGFLRSFMTQYNVTGDTTLISAMRRHYKNYQGKDFADELDVNNAEELMWLFEITNDSIFLQKAEEAYVTFKSDHKFHDRDGRDIDFASDMVPNYHGVCYTEIVKIPAMLYSYTGKKEYLAEAEHGVTQMEKYHLLVSGVPSSSEHFGGKEERSGHETCNLSTIPYTYGYMFRITGDAKWGDKIERAVFNAGIGSISKDFKAHQYFSSPNQFIASMNSCHLGYNPARFVFAPGHDTECCTGNINRFMPYYIGQLWYRSKDDGLVASLFGPSVIESTVGTDQIPVKIVEETKYPFDETITFTVQSEHDVKFPFHIRIPGWANDPKLMIGSEKYEGAVTPGTIVTIDRRFKNGEKITLTLPMEIKATEWPNDGIAIERGPIVYSFPIAAEKKVVAGYKKSTPEFPAFELFPTADWNYSIDPHYLKDIKVTFNDNYTYPWDEDALPVRLQVAAKKLPGWKLFHAVDPKYNYSALQTPGFPIDRNPSKETEYIDLVPYGSTMLRLTVFPKSN